MHSRTGAKPAVRREPAAVGQEGEEKGRFGPVWAHWVNRIITEGEHRHPGISPFEVDGSGGVHRLGSVLFYQAMPANGGGNGQRETQVAYGSEDPPTS